MPPDLTDQDRAELARILRDVIEADRFPFSPKVRRWKELLAKIDPTPEPVVTPYPTATPAGQPSYLLAKKRRR
jgi:hypothetical protein